MRTNEAPPLHKYKFNVYINSNNNDLYTYNIDAQFAQLVAERGSSMEIGNVKREKI